MYLYDSNVVKSLFLLVYVISCSLINIIHTVVSPVDSVDLAADQKAALILILLVQYSPD